MDGSVPRGVDQFRSNAIRCKTVEMLRDGCLFGRFFLLDVLLEPIGTYHIQLCKTLSCMLAGSKTLQEHLQNRLGIKAGETTTDGKFTLSLVECLGSCGTAPCMRLNDDYIENLTLEKLDALLEELSK